MSDQRSDPPSEQASRPLSPPRPHRGIPVGIALGVAGVLLIGGLLVWRAEAKTDKVAMASSPKPVTVIHAPATPYRAERMYVGTIRPWIEASVGPQFISAYVDTVLVRPGAVVKRGDVLATLDCRNASAQTQALASQARAVDARQVAVAHQSNRTQGLLDGGFVSPNEAEQQAAQSAAASAELAASQANLARSALDVNDCILRAPFDGEVATRTTDPGAFVRPGTYIVGVVDRSTVRMTADAPETDFDIVAPGTRVSVVVVSTTKRIDATITRRAPSADPGTRTVHFEIDIFDPTRSIPVDTTGEVHIEVGDPVAATRVPISAVSSNGTKATIFAIDGDVAHSRTFTLLGELGGDMYFRPADLPADTEVVTEGRALLADEDRVTVNVVPAAPAKGSSAIVTPTSTAKPQ